MESIYELSRLNSKYRGIVEAMIPDKDNSPLKKLAIIAYSDKKLTDYESMLAIYGKKNITAFSRLKTRLKEIMYLVLLLQSEVSSDEQSVDGLNTTFENLRKSLAGRILIGRRSNDLGVELMEKLISKSIKFSITDNILMQSRFLLFAYGTYKLNKYKFTKYTDIQRKAIQVYYWEVLAENYFLDLQRYNIQSLANPSEELKSKAFRYHRELDEVKDIKSPSFIYNKFRVLAQYYEYNKDFENLLRECDSAIKYFVSPRLNSTVVIPNIYVRKIWSLIQAGSSKEAIIFGKQISSKLSIGSKSWFRMGYYTLKAYLYRGDYKGAIQLIIILMNNPKFFKLENYYIEIFNTTLGYIHLLIESKMLAFSIDLKKKLPDFKLGKFLNTTPVFSKDKRGINVSILLMHIAFLLQRKNYNAIIDRTDSLNQYAYRYLRRDDSFRSNCMIKMVIQMTKADFHPVRTERYTADLRKQLSSVNLAGSGENIEIEIIPFEVLWEIMVKSL